MSNTEHCTGWGFTNLEGYRHTALMRFVGQLLAATAPAASCLYKLPLLCSILTPNKQEPSLSGNPTALSTSMNSTPGHQSKSHPCHHLSNSFKTSPYLHKSQWPHWQTKSRIYYNLPAITSATVGTCTFIALRLTLLHILKVPDNKASQDKSIIIFTI